MPEKKKKRCIISILPSTKKALDSLKHPGQSYNGKIQELITCWEGVYGVKSDPSQGGKANQEEVTQ